MDCTQPKLLDRLDISDEDFISASSFTPNINTQSTRARRNTWERLRNACAWCACANAGEAQRIVIEENNGEILRDAQGQGQVCVRINSEFFVGSGSVCLLGPSIDFSCGTKFFFLSCAHNFIHSPSNQRKEGVIEDQEHGSGIEVTMSDSAVGMSQRKEISETGWQEATAAVFHYSKTGPENYGVRAQVLDFRIHPKYKAGAQPCAAFDIVVGLLAGNFENAPSCANSYWSYYEYQAPLCVGDEICMVGYPAEKAGRAYKTYSTIAEILDAPNGGKLLVSSLAFSVYSLLSLPHFSC